MDRRTLIAALAAAAATPVVAQTRTLIRYVGMVSAANFPDFLGLVADSTDAVIGLRVSIDPQREPRAAQLDPDGSAHLYDGETEITVLTGAHWAHGGIVLNGFWLVRYGGMYQGVMTFQLEQVPDAMIALNAGLNVVERQI